MLLVSPNRERLPDPVFPLGLSYIASALKRDGHDVTSLDLCFEDNIDEAIRLSVERAMPGVVGLSLRNIDNVSYPRSICYIDHYKNVVKLIRKYTDAVIVLGGAGLTIMPGAFMDALNADYAVAGEGESVFCKLVGNLEQRVIPEEKIIKADAAQSRDWTEIIPDRSLFDIEKYYEHGGMLNIQTKRGCPFRCIYCSYPLIEGRKFRMRTPADVADELKEIVKNTGVRHFFIVDSIFNYPVEFAERICDALIERNLDISWTCYGTPPGMTDRLAEKMKRAGCTSIEFGIDSLIDEYLDVLKKGYNYQSIRQASEICTKHGIKHCLFIFVGAPGETADTAKMNFDRLDALGADVSMIMAGIRIFPNTVLADIAQEELGIDKHSISIKPVYYISPGVMKAMDSIVEDIKKNHPKWILPGFEINIDERLQALLRKAGIRGSLWEELTKR